jgi:hypothetical protein
MEDEGDVSLVDPLSKEWEAIPVEDLGYVHKPVWTKNSVSRCRIALGKTN